MSDLTNKETGIAEEATVLEPAKFPKRKTVADYEQMVKEARSKLALAKREFRDQSARERGRRERDTGKVVLRMIEEGKLDARTVALIRNEVRTSCRSPAQVAAFRDSVFD
jgi:hypothetical protein